MTVANSGITFPHFPAIIIRKHFNNIFTIVYDIVSQTFKFF